MAIIGTLPYVFSNGTTADATQVNADLNAIVNGVNTNAAAITSVQQGLYNYAADTGTVNAIVVPVVLPPTSYTDGLRLRFKAGNTNTSTSVTIATGSLAAKSVVIDAAGTLPVIGSIISGMHYDAEYDISQGAFILINPSWVTTSFTGTLTGFSGSAPTGTVRALVSGNDKAAFVYINATISGTSNAATMTMTGVPSYLSSAALGAGGGGTNSNILVEDNSAAAVGCIASGLNGTTWTFGKNQVQSAGGFTTSATKGILGGTNFSYPL